MEAFTERACYVSKLVERRASRPSSSSATVALHTLWPEIAKVLIVRRCARGAEVNKELQNCVLADPSHADCCTDGIAFNKGRNYFAASLSAQAIHARVMLDRSRNVKSNYTIKIYTSQTI